MSVLAWGLVPVAAGLFAGAWVTWSARPRTTKDNDSLTGHQRFREAMERSSDPKQ
ncbi:hypothetical protein [Streptacidiphilus sp. PAMC 29251]